MLFTLKILRFIVGLIVKVVLFPFKLVFRLVGSGGGGDGSLTPGGEVDTGTGTGSGASTDANTSTTAAAAGATAAAGSSALDTSAAQARKNIGRFRKGLFAFGAFNVLIGLVALVAGPVPGSSLAPIYGGIFVLTIVLGMVPILCGMALTRYPTLGWYGGMGYLALTFAFSILALPSGLLTLGISLLLGYFGYTGRDALLELAGSSLDSMETAEQRDSTISPDESISLADDTASTGSTSGRDDPPTSSTAGEPDTTPDPGTSRAQSRDAGRATDDTTTASPSGSGNATRSNKSEPAGRTSASGSETTTDLDETAAASDAAESSTNPDDVTASSTGADDAVASSGSESDAIADVREDLTAETPATRQEAVQELAHRAQAADVPEQSVVDALSARLDDGDPSVRAEACDALGSLGASAAKPALKERRIDSDPEVSRAASRAIRNLE